MISIQVHILQLQLNPLEQTYKENQKNSRCALQSLSIYLYAALNKHYVMEHQQTHINSSRS